MPFITKEQVAEVRTQIRKEFPDYKISVRREHYSVIDITIQSGPMELITPDCTRRHVQVNQFFIKESYKDFPEISKFLSRIYEIMNEGNGVESEDGDYGTIPNFYTHINIGQWDKPYEVVNK